MKRDLSIAHIQPLLKAFEAAYLNLGIGSFSDAIAIDCINNGPAKITSAFYSHLNEQLDRAKVKSSKLRAIHINRFYNEVYRLQIACDSLAAAFNSPNTN